MRKLLPLLAIACLAALTAAHGQGLELKETPFFEEDVKAGAMSPVADRVPADPLVQPTFWLTLEGSNQASTTPIKG